MSLTIEDLCERSCYRRRTSSAAPARSHLTRLGLLCATLFPAGLGPRASLALGCDAGPRPSYRDGGLADHGVGPGAAVHALPPGPQPGHLVSAPGQSEAARAAPHGPCAPRGHARLRCRRHGGTPVRAEAQSDRLLPGGCALHQKARHPRRGLAVGVHEALGAGALEPAGVGGALFDSPLLAQAKARHTTAYNQRGLGAAEAEIRASLAARAAAGLGRRWRLRGRGAGAGLCQKSGAPGLAPAPGGGPVSPPQDRRPRANGVLTPPRASANGAGRAGQSAAIPPGRPWQSRGTVASVKSCGASRALPCGSPPGCPPESAAPGWWRTRRANCAWKRSSVPIYRRRRRRAWRGSSCAGRSR